MPRSKNPAIVSETVGPRAQAFSRNILSDTSSMKAEKEFLELISLKRRLGILSEEQFNEYLGSASGQAQEEAMLQVLTNLNRFSEFDSRLERVYQMFGSRSKIEVARKISQKMVASAATKRVLAETIGVTPNQIGSFGNTYVEQDLQRSEAALLRNPMASARAAFARAGVGSGAEV